MNPRIECGGFPARFSVKYNLAPVPPLSLTFFGSRTGDPRVAPHSIVELEVRGSATNLQFDIKKPERPACGLMSMRKSKKCQGESRGDRGYGHQVRELEQDLAQRWWNLPVGIHLPLNDGNCCQLVFAGRPGGTVGPDVHDAVLDFSYSLKSRSARRISSHCEHGKKQVGDVEFHVRSSDWFAHQHHTDARYNNVILHIVLICDDPAPILRQDGAIIPFCSLYDLCNLLDPSLLTPGWPCQHLMSQLNDQERTRLLQQAGLLRFEQKAHAFVELLHNASPSKQFSAYDTCLIPALAESLGYGRDRAFFRAVGLHLLDLPHTVPEPLGRMAEPPSLDASRLHILSDLVEQWRETGAWETLRRIMTSIPLEPTRRSTGMDVIHNIHSVFGRLSTARTDIVICNVVLPFTTAVALIEHDISLAERARELYLAYPDLSSNQITRAMSKHLQVKAHGACQQQGLHYIYQQTCREKRCGECIAGKRDI
jgi:hypothetical protein